MLGEVSILNVGRGDTKLSFDKDNPAERIRSARIVKDMLRRGYALLIEVDDGAGGKTTQRVQDFDDNACEYIIADFDPIIAAAEDKEDHERDIRLDIVGDQSTQAPETAPVSTLPPQRRGRRTKRVEATATRAVAIGRTGGG